MSFGATAPNAPERRIADILAVLFALVILLYAAGGPISDFVRWFVEATTADFEELSRRDQRVLLREHWLGAAWRAVERGFLQPTGLILGLPILFGLVISSLTLHDRPGLRWLNWLLAIVSIVTLTQWIVGVFATDAGLLPSADPIDFVIFPLASAVTLYLTWRMFGGFIAAFCLFWVIYLFLRGDLPGWMGILQGSDAPFDQNLRAMVQNFWSQTGGMFGQHPRDSIGSIGKPDMAQGYALFGQHLLPHGGDEIIRALIAAPSMEIDRLPCCPALHIRPVLGHGGGDAQSSEQCGEVGFHKALRHVEFSERQSSLGASAGPS